MRLIGAALAVFLHDIRASTFDFDGPSAARTSIRLRRSKGCASGAAIFPIRHDSATSSSETRVLRMHEALANDRSGNGASRRPLRWMSTRCRQN